MVTEVKRCTALSVAALVLGVASAAEWEDLSVNSINRLPPRTYAMPLADEAAATNSEQGLPIM